MSNKHAEVIVVGGGLAGLAAAAWVARSGRPVTVLEGRRRLGGRATTERKDGFWLNQGPHALYRGGPGEAVLNELGVPLRGGRPPVKGRLVFDGRLRLAPAGPASLLRSGALTSREKLEIGRLLATLPKIDPAELAAVAVEEWVARSVGGARSAQLLHALARLATYVNDPTELSAEVAVTQLQAALGAGVAYLDHGWQTMIDHLAAVPGVRVERDRSVTELPDAPAVIVAAGGPQAAGALLGRAFDVGPAATASCLDLGVRRPPPHDFVLGGDVPFYLSNHSAVAALAPEGSYHLAAAQYLGPGEAPDERGLRAFVWLAGVDDDDIVMSRRLHRMMTVTAFATAARGGLAGRPAVTDTGAPNVFLAGDWVGPVGHLADAALASARAAADAALAHVASARSRR